MRKPELTLRVDLYLILSTCDRFSDYMKITYVLGALENATFVLLVNKLWHYSIGIDTNEMLGVYFSRVCI